LLSFAATGVGTLAKIDGWLNKNSLDLKEPDNFLFSADGIEAVDEGRSPRLKYKREKIEGFGTRVVGNYQIGICVRQDLHQLFNCLG
jgi:hypothetical protein